MSGFRAGRGPSQVWRAADHPRQPAGSARGGEFKRKLIEAPTVAEQGAWERDFADRQAAAGANRLPFGLRKRVLAGEITESEARAMLRRRT